MFRIARMLPESKRGEYADLNDLEMTESVDFTLSPTATGSG
jgi:hypothetical protein